MRLAKRASSMEYSPKSIKAYFSDWNLESYTLWMGLE